MEERFQILSENSLIILFILLGPVHDDVLAEYFDCVLERKFFELLTHVGCLFDLCSFLGLN